jgi:hypothetical protein
MPQRSVRKGDLIIVSPDYKRVHYPHVDDMDPDKYHLCEATSGTDRHGAFSLAVISSEDTQAMCEALAHSMFGDRTVWIPRPDSYK